MKWLEIGSVIIFAFFNLPNILWCVPFDFWRYNVIEWWGLVVEGIPNNADRKHYPSSIQWVGFHSLTVTQHLENISPTSFSLP